MRASSLEVGWARMLQTYAKEPRALVKLWRMGSCCLEGSRFRLSGLGFGVSVGKTVSFVAGPLVIRTQGSL